MTCRLSAEDIIPQKTHTTPIPFLPGLNPGVPEPVFIQEHSAGMLLYPAERISSVYEKGSSSTPVVVRQVRERGYPLYRHLGSLYHCILPDHRMADLRPRFWLLGYLAADHQHQHNHYYLPDGIPDPEEPE